jgi:predicted NACHT family NTPase
MGKGTSQHNRQTTTTRQLSSREEVRDFLVALLQQARRKISVFAPTLDGDLFNTSQVIDVLASFTAVHRGNLVRFLVEDADQSLHQNARVVGLCRRFSDFIQIHQVDEDNTGLREQFVIVDDCGYLHQPHLDRPEFRASSDDRSETRQFIIRYERMWERSQSMPGVHTLGL